MDILRWKNESSKKKSQLEICKYNLKEELIKLGSTERLDDPTDASLFSFQDMFLFLKKLCKSFIVNLVFDKDWLRFQEIGSNVNISVEVVEASNFDPG